MNLHATQASAEERSRGPTMKFTHASGARPLDGYTIKRGIGRGGFGEVYYAVSDAGKEVALKLIRRHLEVELRGVRQCLNLKHPNLLAIHDIRTDADDDRWVIMEYISGESLEALLERNPNGVPLEEALGWIRGMAAGVAYLHDHGIVHRDLKPGNIFSDEGIVKIGDYGLSKFVSCSRRSGQTESVGTVHYMAPEIANGRYGKEIDIYALGIILYEILTGRVPFEGESVGEVLMKHLTAEPDVSMLAEPFRTIAERSLAKDPEVRFRNVKDMIALLPAGGSGFGVIGSATPHAHLESVSSGNAGVGAKSPGAAEPEAVAIEVVDESEPILRYAKQQFRQVTELWNSADFNPGLKIAILVGGAFLLLSSVSLWIPLSLALAILYGGYRVVRAIVLASKAAHVRSKSIQPVAELVSATEVPLAPPRRRRNWRHDELAQLPAKPTQLKLTELTGSMLLSAGIAIIMAVVMMVLRGQSMQIEQFAWLAVVGAVGSWAVMIPAKGWEGTSGDQAARRFVMLVAGLLVGAVAFGLATFLHVDLYPDLAMRVTSPLRGHLPEGFYGVDGTPKLLAHLSYFGFLLLVLRWWRQSDPARNTRLSLWATACAIFAAWVLNYFSPFPQPWGLMIAAVMAVSIQLSSPWVPLKPETRL